MPALRGLESTPLSRLLIEVDGTEGEIALTGADVDAKTASGSLDRLSVLSTGSRASISSARAATPLADGLALGDARVPSDLVRFRGSLPLAPGTNVLWIVGRLHDDVDLDGRIAVAWKELRFSDGRRLAPRPDTDPAPSPSRTGVALRRAGDGGVHTTRIPGLATTAKGTLIAVYDLRHGGAGDLPADIDVGMSRSVDGGRSWEPTRTIIDMGSDPDWRQDGVGDPSILVDRRSNTIWVAALWSHGDRGWTGSGPGLEPTQTGQLVLVKSEDDGKTWSRPINITKQVKRPEWTLLLQGPGKGIRMKDGTLVFPAQYRDSVEKGRIPHSTIISSRNGGRSWRAGTGAHPHRRRRRSWRRSRAVLMLNCRYDRGNQRVVMISRDLGATWSEHESSRKLLVEPGACMAKA
ncbi:MAG: exo-alpha-sialidase [Planctomycetota bacterium]